MGRRDGEVLGTFCVCELLELSLYRGRTDRENVALIYLVAHLLNMRT